MADDFDRSLVGNLLVPLAFLWCWCLVLLLRIVLGCWHWLRLLLLLLNQMLRHLLIMNHRMLLDGRRSLVKGICRSLGLMGVERLVGHRACPRSRRVAARTALDDLLSVELSRNLVCLNWSWICVQSCNPRIVLLCNVIRSMDWETRSSMHHRCRLRVFRNRRVVVLGSSGQTVTMAIRMWNWICLHLVMTKIGKRMCSMHLVPMLHHGVLYLHVVWPLHLARVLWRRR